MNKYIVYTDGSRKGNPDKKETIKGGWSAVICDKSGKVIKELYSGFINTTSARMEIMGVLEALKYIKEPSEIEIISDSLYVVSSIGKRWIDYYLKAPNGRANIDLWKEIYPYLDYHKVNISWTKGHSTDEMNNRADKLAQFAARCLNLPEDEYIDNGEENWESLVSESKTWGSDGSNTRQENGKILYSLG